MMHAATDLRHLQKAAIRQLANIQARLVAGSRLSVKEAERVAALCLIDAQSTWSLFVRSFFVSCTLGARRVGGGRTSTSVPGIKTAADAIKFATFAIKPSVKTKKGSIGPLDEPPWHLGWVLPRLARDAGLSNTAQVVAAYSIPGRALEDLPKARNFFAHRSHKTADVLRALAPQYGLPGSIRAGALPVQLHPKRQGMIASGWVAELSAMVKLLPI